MQNTSSLYKELIKQSGRLFKAEIAVTFPNGSTAELTDENIMQDSLVITSGRSDEGSFSIGNAIIGQLDFEIDNSSGAYDNLSFEDAVFDVRVGLIVRQKYDGTLTPEWIRKGIFTAEEVTVDGKMHQTSSLNWSGGFYDGILSNLTDTLGSGTYEDGTSLKTDENENLVQYYKDDAGNLEFVLTARTSGQSMSLVGQKIHVNFENLGTVSKAAFESDTEVEGNWNFTIQLPSVSFEKRSKLESRSKEQILC